MLIVMCRFMCGSYSQALNQTLYHPSMLFVKLGLFSKSHAKVSMQKGVQLGLVFTCAESFSLVIVTVGILLPSQQLLVLIVGNFAQCFVHANNSLCSM